MQPNRTAALLALTAGALVSMSGVLHAQEADLPIRNITLYRAGVGYFERAGTVDGAANVSLRFDRKQVNDILKSLVLLDLDGGRVDSVGFSTKEPLERRLAGFGINIGDKPSLGMILDRLRGERVRLSTSEGPIEGTILGVEMRMINEDVGGQPRSTSETFVNVLTGANLRSVAISRITTFELLNPQVSNDLHAALAMLAEAREENLATIDLRFNGAGKRRAVVGYVHETPVWKTSYRLILPEETGSDFSIQGWAIVENTTNTDWTDVRLSLVSGNPVSFVMDLHEPLFMQRPSVPVPVMGTIVSRVYDSTVKAAAAAAAPAEGMRDMMLRARRLDTQGQSLAPMRAAPGQADGVEESYEYDLSDYAVHAVATGGEVGEQFRYTVSVPVTIERQRSAMLPIIAGPIKGRRVSIYNPADLSQNPMRGVEITNTSGVDLAPGPISVIDGSAFAGDAQVGFTSRGQDRILSYAADLDVRALMETKQTEDVHRLTIVDGMIKRENVRRITTSYRFINRDGSRPRTILVEQPKRQGWDVKSPEKIASESESLRRFEVKVDAGKETALDVVEEMTTWTSLAVTSFDLPTILSFQQRGKASKAVVDALSKAADLQGKVNRHKEEISTLDTQRRRIFEDQARIRSNISQTSNRTGDLYARYMQTLAEQETRLVAIETQFEAATAALDAAQRELDNFLKNLNVQ